MNESRFRCKFVCMSWNGARSAQLKYLELVRGKALAFTALE